MHFRINADAFMLFVTSLSIAVSVTTDCVQLSSSGIHKVSRQTLNSVSQSSWIFVFFQCIAILLTPVLLYWPLMTLMTVATVDGDGDGDGDDDEAASLVAIHEKCSFIRFSYFCSLLLMSFNSLLELSMKDTKSSLPTKMMVNERRK